MATITLGQLDGTIVESGTIVPFNPQTATFDNIILDDTVTSIPNNYFREYFGGDHKLKSIDFTSSTKLESIGYDTFHFCTALTNINLPSSLTSIGNQAFNLCTALTSITIPNSVTSIGNYAFTQCTALTSITIPSSVTSIGYNAFIHCSSLTSIIIPNSVSIAEFNGFAWNERGTFNGCTSLTSVTLPISLPSIVDSMFANCTSLTTINLPSNLTSIATNAFLNCPLTSVTLPSSLTNIGSNAFTKSGTRTIGYYTGSLNFTNDPDTGLDFQPSPSAGSSGDPYVTTFSGHKYKLPNIVRTYRLVEHNNVIVNATVSELTDKEKEDMKQLGLKEGTENMFNGYFYESFYITNGKDSIFFDRNLNVVENDGYEITEGKGKFTCPIQGKSDYTSKTINVEDVEIKLMKYTNPQILNGIDVSGDLLKSKGLLNSIYNPKNSMVKNIKSVKPLKSVKGIVYNYKQKELWVKKRTMC